MSNFEYDLFVIGGGSAGVRASRLAASHGARVAIAEEYGFGGTCVLRGCIPKKLFVYASRFAEEFEDSAGYGWSIGSSSFSWPKLIAAKDKEIARLEGLYKENIQRAGAEIILDRAEFTGPHEIALKNSGRKITAERILIATGGRPSWDLGAGISGAEHCITSNEAFHLKELPQKIIIAGGGYIAVEFAQIFHGLGVDVTLVYRGEKILRGFDDDMRDALTDALKESGIRLLTNCVFKNVGLRGQTRIVTTNIGETLEADQVLLAIGRIPNTDGLGLANAGVTIGARGAVVVDAYSQTSQPHIHALGDVTDRIALTPVAIHEAMCFIRTVYEGKPTKADHHLVPSAVFTTPEIGTVGLSEADALAHGHTIDVYRSSFRPLKNTVSGRAVRSVMKLIVDAQTDRVLGCHLFSPDAGEMTQLIAVALKMGATKAQLDATIALHPSAAEELVTMRTRSYSKAPV